MFGNKDAALRRQAEEQAALLQQYSDMLRALIVHAGGVVPPEAGVSGLIQPGIADTALRHAIDRLTGGGGRLSKTEHGSETRPLTASVCRINLAGAADLVIQQGDTASMTVRCEDGTFLPKVLTTVSGNRLTVDTEPTMVTNFVTGNGRGVVTQVFKGRVGGQVAMGDIINRGGSQYCVGNGNIQISGNAVQGLGVEVTVVLPRISDLEVSGAGRVTYQGFRQDEFNMEISGSGQVELGGSVGRLEVEVSGSGDVSAYDLTATNARLSVSGAGSVRATVTESVRARVAGAGKIKIAGNPAQRDVNTSGVGKIKFVDRDR